MASTTSLPMKTTEVDLDKVSDYLKSQVGWVPIDRIKTAIPSKHANPMKIEAMRHVGLIERDGQNVKLTQDGREYAAGDGEKRAAVMRARLRLVPLYHSTLEWMHYSQKLAVTKTDIANYWHDHHAAEIGGAEGDALTDSTVFFMRMVGVSGLGKFSAAGVGRDTNLSMDAERLEAYATDAAPPQKELPPIEDDDDAEQPPPPPPPPRTSLSVSSGLNVTVEIHIAADAKPATIEEIFKNMRRYLIDGSPTPDGS